MQTQNEQPESVPVDAIVMRCDLCRWWREYDHKPHRDDSEGKCMRFPPVQNVAAATEEGTGNGIGQQEMTDVVDGSWYWVQPVTTGDDYCGEFIAGKSQEKIGHCTVCDTYHDDQCKACSA